MPRYIEADSLIRTLYIQADDDGFICCGVEDLDALIGAQITSDVVERKKGNWVGIDDEPCETFECDNCGFVLEDWNQGALYNFCPHCGADMRKGEDDGEIY